MNTLDLFSLEGKTALVTGCDQGIGKAMAIALAEAGADIIGASIAIPLHDSEVEKQVKSVGRKFYAYQVDLSIRDSIYNLVAVIKKGSSCY